MAPDTGEAGAPLGLSPALVLVPPRAISCIDGPLLQCPCVPLLGFRAEPPPAAPSRASGRFIVLCEVQEVFFLEVAVSLCPPLRKLLNNALPTL